MKRIRSRTAAVLLDLLVVACLASSLASEAAAEVAASRTVKPRRRVALAANAATEERPSDAAVVRRTRHAAASASRTPPASGTSRAFKASGPGKAARDVGDAKGADVTVGRARIDPTERARPRTPSERLAEAKVALDSAGAVAPEVPSNNQAVARERDAFSERASSTKTAPDKVGNKGAPVTATSAKSALDAPSVRASDVTSPSVAKAPIGAATRAALGTLSDDSADPSRSVTDPPLTGGARREVTAAAPSTVTANTAPSGPHTVVVSYEGPTFEGGDVPRAAAALERMKGTFVRCASAPAALARAEASMDLRFLVRAPGRAEGVDAEKVRGMSSDVVRCMTQALARSYVGAPSDDPVGVRVSVRVRKD